MYIYIYIYIYIYVQYFSIVNVLLFTIEKANNMRSYSPGQPKAIISRQQMT